MAEAIKYQGDLEKNTIKYPYLPEGKTIKYVPTDNPFMIEAKKISRSTGCAKQATGAVIVKEGKIIGSGSNAGVKIEICPRVEKGSKTGEDYHLCKEVCQQESHSEVASINDAIKNNHDISGADLYLYGHWWCCQSCWDAINAAGINNVYLLEDSHITFNSEINK